MRTDTRLVTIPTPVGGPPSIAPPLYQTATFEIDPDGGSPWDYTRSGNPTRALVENQVADLEGGRHGFAFASGMAAITAVLRTLSAGDHVIAGEDLYGGTWRLLSQLAPRQGLDVTYVDTCDAAAVEAAVTDRTRLVLVETPTNPLLRICDLAALARVTSRRGIRLAVDSSSMSPYLQRPLRHGADIVLHSGTKYLAGHSDVTAGLVVVNDEELAREIGFVQNAEGSGLAPFEAWLLARGIKTLGIRLDRQQTNASRIVAWLESHPAVTAIHWPGRTEHPGAAIHESQARGPGAVISFETGAVEVSRALVAAARLFKVAVSFGSVSSLISLPGAMSHASIPADVRASRELPEDLVRLSIGIEDAEDLLADLTQAFRHASDTMPCAAGG